MATDRKELYMDKDLVNRLNNLMFELNCIKQKLYNDTRGRRRCYKRGKRKGIDISMELIKKYLDGS